MSSRYGGISTGRKVRTEKGMRMVYKGERGGRFYILDGEKIHLPRSGIPVAIPIRHLGSLTELGYHAHAPERSRRAALRAAIAHYGRADVMRKLNALYVFNKNRHPQLAAIYAMDKSYIGYAK